MADINFFQPEQVSESKRRRKLAELLAQNVPQSDPSKMVSGLVVPVSPLQGLAEGLSKGIQTYQTSKADQIDAEREKAMAGAYAGALGQFGTDPTAASAELMKIDPNLGIQLMNATKNTDEKTKEIKNFEYINSLPPEQRQAASSMITPKAGGVIGYDEAGNPIVSAKPVELSTRDQIVLGKIDEEASAANSYINQADQALNLLNKMETGKGTNVKGVTAGWAKSLGIGGQETADFATNYDDLNALSKSLGAQALQQFGGNDTDKELQVAITSNLSPENTTEANKEIINRKINASKILAQRADFYTQFANKNGSLKAVDPDTGKSVSSSWMEYQRQMLKELTGKPAQTAPATTGANNTDIVDYTEYFK